MKYEKIKLGNLIKQIDLRNKNCEINYLLGVSNEKKLIPSIANINGTDLSNYKVLRKNQFIYVPTTSRNGDKISIALMEETECIVSSSYTVFEITDFNKLLPDYLMLIFNAPEFDRYARFMSFGTAREIFDWNAMCDTTISIPDKEIQIKIVKEYNMIINKIELLKNEKELLYKIIENIFLEFNNDKELKKVLIENIALNIVCGGTPSTEESKYWDGEYPFLTIPDMHNRIFQCKDTKRTLTMLGVENKKTKIVPKNSIAVSCIASAGLTVITTTECITNQQINSILCDEEKIYYLYMVMKQMKNKIINAGDSGSVAANLNKSNFSKLEIHVLNNEELYYKFNKKTSSLFEKIQGIEDIYSNLNRLKNILISKMNYEGGI